MVIVGRQSHQYRKVVDAEQSLFVVSCILPTIPVAYGALRAIKRLGHFRLLKGKDSDGGYTKIAVKDHIICAGPVRVRWGLFLCAIHLLRMLTLDLYVKQDMVSPAYAHSRFSQTWL